MQNKTIESDFLHLAGHKMRNSLTALKWITSLLQSEKLGPLTTSQKEYLQAMAIQEENILALIEESHYASKIERGGNELVLTGSSSLSAISQQVLGSFDPVVKKKKLQLVTQIDPNLTLLANPDEMKLLVRVLLRNAITYTPEEGKVTFTLSAEKDTILIVIEDTGAGISLSDQPLIFQKFFRGENVRVLEPEGTGLGLYIAEHITKKYHGTLTFESVEGKGSRFCVTLPITLPAK